MKTDTVHRILEIGTDLIIKKGFHNVGLQEILTAAEIPKGSFYYYFKSKEDFGLQVIEFYSRNALQLLKTYVEDTSKNHRDRILEFYRGAKSMYTEKAYTEGCLLGNCSLELSDLKSSYAQKIEGEFEVWEDVLAVCIAEGQEEGTIQNPKDSKIIAAFILNSFEGAILRMKAMKSAQPLMVFIGFLEEILH